MEQQPTPIIELLEMIFLLGSITFVLGALFQGFVLYRNKKSIWKGMGIILITRILTVPATMFILTIQHYPITPVFVSIIAILPETVFSILILKVFGNKMNKIKMPVHSKV